MSAQALSDDTGRFDEIYYLDSNPEVADAVKLGHFDSGYHHYILHGKAEGRQQSPSEDEVLGPDDGLSRVRHLHNRTSFLTPTAISQSPNVLRRIALIGSCFLNRWGFHQSNLESCPVDLLVSGATPPVISEEVAAEYDFVVVQIPFRSVFTDGSLWRLGYGDLEGYERAYAAACARLDALLQRNMAWNDHYGLLTFVPNFMLPQNSAVGRLLPYFDLRNPEYFVSKINEHLERTVRSYNNAYILNVDRVAASYGRRYLQDDVTTTISHNSLYGLPPERTDRMEFVAAMSDHFDILTEDYISSIWSELMAMYRTIRQTDSVKMVVVDLDDTLWNGVIGDMADVDPSIIEGWPLGVAEALAYLRKRGILTAIISKNEEGRIRALWPKIFGDTMSLDDFAAVYINWQPKSENMRDLLGAVNILPKSVVFVDDNPAERQAMEQAFPGIRTLGRHPYYIRQVLLWSAETQVAHITTESENRAAMVKSQIVRENTKRRLDPNEFLKQVAPRISMGAVHSIADASFPRCLELINKTNQFNTTGKRWAQTECKAFFDRGGTFETFVVEDSFTNYGLVGVVLINGASIEQWVMSCRVLGYMIEDAVMAHVVEKMRGSQSCEISAQLAITEANFPCRDLFAKNGFVRDEAGDWKLPPECEVSIPGHVSIS